MPVAMVNLRPISVLTALIALLAVMLSPDISRAGGSKAVNSLSVSHKDNQAGRMGPIPDVTVTPPDDHTPIPRPDVDTAEDGARGLKAGKVDIYTAPIQTLERTPGFGAAVDPEDDTGNQGERLPEGPKVHGVDNMPRPDPPH